MKVERAVIGSLWEYLTVAHRLNVSYVYMYKS